MPTSLLISVDTHVAEPLDLWSSRLPKHLRDRALRGEHIGDGRFLETHYPGGGRIAMERDRHADGSLMEFIGGGPPEKTMADLDADGIWGAVALPNAGMMGSFGADHELALAHARVYNDWLVEAYGPYRPRIALAATIPLTDVGDAVREIERIAAKGFSAIIVPVMPPRPYAGETFDPVWAAAEANGMQVIMHLATGFLTDAQGRPVSNAFSMTDAAGHADPDSESSQAEQAMGTLMAAAGVAPVGHSYHPVARRLLEQEASSHTAKRAIMSLIGGGVLERFPSLHFSFIEFDAHWLPSLVAAMDISFRVGIGQDTSLLEGVWDHTKSTEEQTGLVRMFDLEGKWPYPLAPSDYIRRQVHVSFMDDPVAVAMRQVVGVQSLMWGNDYAHPEGTYPKSRDALDQLLKDVPTDERTAIVGGTAAHVFGFDLPATV
jgi:predicted TIM-barrel fold metal-dependent hydrolase